MVTIPMNRYRHNGTAEKVRGAVYTPSRVAAALVRWAVRSCEDRVLDPSCGDGVFLEAAEKRLLDLCSKRPVCVGIDVDEQAAMAAGAICGDFFRWAQDASSFGSHLTFDAVVGNPPFIRSHLFPESSRSLAFQQMKQMGLNPSRLMSTWAPFIAVSCKLLADNGRLAFVVPEELLHVGYAKALRHFLLSRFRRVIICLPENDLFPSVQQSVILLLCDNDPDGPPGLLTMPFAGLEDGPPYLADTAPVCSWSSKWTHLFLSPKERGAISESFSNLRWKPLSEYGRVEVGVVTGANDFFIMSKADADTLGATSYLAPIVTNARYLKGIEFSDVDFKQLIAQDRPSFLLDISKDTEHLPEKLRHYLESGVSNGINMQFKCRNRQPWYTVPSIWPADALLLRQAGEMPKLVHLSQKCTSTDTIHRVRWHNPSLGKRHVVSFLNSCSLVACELTGRSYGGGVLELMPSEANNIALPPPSMQLEKLFNEVDCVMRSREFETAIDMVDRIVMLPRLERSEYEGMRNTLSKLIRRRKMKHNGHN